jgi:hypothetical protein
LDFAKGLIKAAGESDVADAYFKDQARNLHLRIQKAFIAANFVEIPTRMAAKRESKTVQDMQKADSLLQAALANSAGGGSDAGSGSSGGSAITVTVYSAITVTVYSTPNCSRLIPPPHRSPW